MTVSCTRTIWSFSPQVTAIGGIPSPSTVPPVYAHLSDLVLTYGATVVTLRSPQWGDSRTVIVESARDATMSNVLTIGRNPLWPTVEVFKFTFTALSDAVVSDYFAFSILTAGKQITLRDHQSQTWTGFILNPDGQSTQAGQQCDNDLEISFRGTLVA